MHNNKRYNVGSQCQFLDNGDIPTFALNGIYH